MKKDEYSKPTFTPPPMNVKTQYHDPYSPSNNPSMRFFPSEIRGRGMERGIEYRDNDTTYKTFKDEKIVGVGIEKETGGCIII